MKLSITIVDERMARTPSYSTPKTETYERVAVADLTAGSRVVADFLRGIANDIDPMTEVAR